MNYLLPKTLPNKPYGPYAVTTLSAAAHITPTVFKTFLKHSKRTTVKFKPYYSTTFNIVKKFTEMGPKNTVESLQAFTNTHVPAPYWAAVSPVGIPLSSCNRSADLLIDWFGPEDMDRVVGGEPWWQVRGLDGVDGEWITETKYLSSDKVDGPHHGRKLTGDEENILKMEHRNAVMLYVHGGDYFWGLTNTHRYQIIRYGDSRLIFVL